MDTHREAYLCCIACLQRFNVPALLLISSEQFVAHLSPMSTTLTDHPRQLAQEKQPSSCWSFGHVPHVTHSRLFAVHQAEVLFTLADVAASWTSMAIIEQRVRWQGFWVEEVSSESVQRHKSAEKQEGKCRRMCSSENWTLQTTQDLMVAGWKWWQMALHCGAEHSKLSTPRWCPLSTKTGHPAAGRTPPMDQCWRRLASGRNRRTPNLQDKSGTSGGFGCGDRRPMVRRDCAVSARIGQGSRPR